MIFTTPGFVVFAALFFTGWALVGGRGRRLWLLASSYAFYGAWDWRFLGLLWISTAVDYWVGLRLHAARDPLARRRLVRLSVATNLGILGFFKYFDFFTESLAALLSSLGISADIPTLRLVLPVGISFYTFQTMSYTLDIHAGRMRPTESLIDFANYVTFFPQLVAGPIERARHLLPQLSGLDALRPDHSGWGLIALGAFKKVVIADNIAWLVEATYDAPGATPGPALWLGTYAFAVQIYCDFSGYSDIAVGLGRLLGVDIVQNFRAPYGADGPRDFWRRWHISLSTWLRDYLYIGLGGNRGSALRTQRNLLLTMLLGGLWHGAAWNFVLWGAFHGALLIVARLPPFARLDAAVGRLPTAAAAVARVAWRLVFFHITCLGWALFRAESLNDCAALMRGLLDVRHWDLGGWWSAVEAAGDGQRLTFWLAVVAAFVLTQNVARIGSDTVVARLWRAPWGVRFALVVVLLYACVLWAPAEPPPFIYFQF